MCACVCVGCIGGLSMLMRLIHDGHLRPEQMEQLTEEELLAILEQCGVPSAPNSTKVYTQHTHWHTHCCVDVVSLVTEKKGVSLFYVFCWQDELMASVSLLYTQVQNGLSTAPQPAQHLTAGKLSKVCPHQVKYPRMSISFPYT